MPAARRRRRKFSGATQPFGRGAQENHSIIADPHKGEAFQVAGHKKVPCGIENHGFTNKESRPPQRIELARGPTLVPVADGVFIDVRNIDENTINDPWQSGP